MTRGSKIKSQLREQTQQAIEITSPDGGDGRMCCSLILDGSSPRTGMMQTGSPTYSGSRYARPALSGARPNAANTCRFPYILSPPFNFVHSFFYFLLSLKSDEPDRSGRAHHFFLANLYCANFTKTLLYFYLVRLIFFLSNLCKKSKMGTVPRGTKEMIKHHLKGVLIDEVLRISPDAGRYADAVHDARLLHPQH